MLSLPSVLSSQSLCKSDSDTAFLSFSHRMNNSGYWVKSCAHFCVYLQFPFNSSIMDTFRDCAVITRSAMDGGKALSIINAWPGLD